jgi:gliding motility-associated-like protein
MKPKLPFLRRIAWKGISLLFSLLCLSFVAIGQDTPPPSPSYVNFGAGSYIIPMDNAKQALNGEPFNLSAYGLIYELLDNGIALDWVIRSGKQKDEVDFTVMAERVFPSTTTPALTDFIASAFIIDVSLVETQGNCTGTVDVSQVDAIIQAFGSDVAVYRTTQALVADVRYHLTNAPLIGILDDGGFTETGADVLAYAEVPHNIISYNEFEANGACYTMIVQPHLSNQSSNTDYTAVISNFVNGGGNFFAQCSAIESYEEAALFLTTQGANYYSQNILNDPLSYINNDMPIMQFHGDVQGFGVGSNSHFQLVDTFQPYAYGGVFGTNEDGGMSYLVCAGDLNGATIGGNIFYLAGHNYTPQTQIQSGGGGGGGGNSYFSDVIDSYNMNRVMLNSMFVPATWATICTAPDQCICPGESAQIGCDFNLNIQYTWSPAASLDCADCANPSASPSATTVYTATSDNGCSSVSVTVFVDCPFSNTISAATEPVCEGTCSFIAIETDFPGNPVSVSLNNVLYAWNDTIEVCPSQTTLYNVEVINDLGTSFITEVELEIWEMPTLSTNDLTLCFGESGTLTASGADTFLWSDTNTNGANFSLVADSSYNYEVIGTMANGCSDSTTASLTVIPIESIIETDQVDLCAYDACFEITGTGISQISWYDGYNQFISNEFSIVECPTVSTFYVATTSDIGCYWPDTVFVNFVPIPDIEAGDDISICPGIEVNLVAEGASYYVWTTLDGDVIEGNSPITSFYQDETLIVEGFTAEGCSWTDTIAVTVFPVPIALFEVDTLNGVNIGSELLFEDLSTGATCWSWNFGYYGSPEITTPDAVYAYPESGDFEVVLTVCNDFGCFDEYAVWIHITHEFAFYVPNAISPNDDGLNDVFFVDGIGIDTTGFKLDIYNRWGELIYTLNDPSDVWMGQYRSDQGYYVQDGVYDWVLTLRDEETHLDYEASGHVLIIR